MKYFKSLFLSAIWSVLCLSVFAIPNLYQQISNVNKFVSMQNDVDKNSLKQISLPDLSSEQAISLHLQLVEYTLRKRDVGHLNESQKKKRSLCLDDLRKYWMQGEYPKNKDFIFKIPYFIDEENTACAVGALVIESGYKSIAEEIAKKQNNAYVYDIENKELLIWAEDHGFSLNELAWIQPAYDPCGYFPVQAEISSTSCSSNDGSIFIDLDYSYNVDEAYWEDTGLFSNYRNNLEAGVYSLIVKYNSYAGINCNKRLNYIIQSDNGPAFYLNSEYNYCPDELATAEVSNISGDGPFTIEWHDGSNLNTVSNLEATSWNNNIYSPNYYVKVKDVNNCTKIQTVYTYIANSLHYPAITHADCNNNGTIDINPSNYSGSPYTYLWSNGETTEDISNLSPGNYCLTIETVDNCIEETCYIILNTCNDYQFLYDDHLSVENDEILSLVDNYNQVYTLYENDLIEDIGIVNAYYYGPNFAIVDDPVNGSILVDGWTNLAYSYLPNNNFTGTDSFTYTVYNAYNNTIADTATVYIDVLPNSQSTVLSIVAVDDTAGTNGDDPIIIDNPLCNDYEITNDSTATQWVQKKWKLRYWSGGFAGLDPFIVPDGFESFFEFTSDSLFGSGYFGTYDYEGPYTISYSYYPVVELDSSSNFWNDEFSLYEISDSILVMGEIAADGFFNHFVPMSNFSFTIIDQGTYGTAYVDNDGIVVYEPNTANDLTDTIIYVACNNYFMCDTAYIIINADGTVINNNAPIANDDYAEGMGYTSIEIYALSNDIEPDGESLTVNILNYPSCGNLTYDPVYQIFNFTFVDETSCNFTYEICDPFGACDQAVVELVYYCHPWDYVVEVVYDTITGNPYHPIYDFCNGTSTEIYLNHDPNNIQINFNTDDMEITFLNAFTGVDTISYTMNTIDDLGCIVCGVVVENIILFDPESDLNDNVYEDITVYPNPADDIIQIKITPEVFEQASIYNKDGKLMRISEDININIDDLAVGNYFVKIDLKNEELIMRQFIKK